MHLYQVKIMSQDTIVMTLGDVWDSYLKVKSIRIRRKRDIGYTLLHRNTHIYTHTQQQPHIHSPVVLQFSEALKNTI